MNYFKIQVRFVDEIIKKDGLSDALISPIDVALAIVSIEVFTLESHPAEMLSLLDAVFFKDFFRYRILLQ